MLSSKIIKGAVLKVYKGAPHGRCTTLKDKVNADLLDFIEAKAARASGRAGRSAASARLKLPTARVAPDLGATPKERGCR